MLGRKRRPLFLSLEAKAAAFGMSPAEMRQWYRDQGFSDETLQVAFQPDQLAAPITGPALQLIPAAAEMLSITERKLRRALKVSLANTPDVNCGARRRRTATGKRLITAHAGYLLFFHKLSYAYGSQAANEAGEPEIPWAIPEAIQLLNSFYGAPAQRNMAWSLQPWATTSRQRFAVAMLWSGLLEATVAHELGHIVHDLARSRCVEARWVERELPALLTSIGHTEALARWRPEWTDEIVADIIAAQLLRDATWRPEFALQSGLGALLMIFELIEKWQPSSLEHTHPPAAVRRAVTREEFPHIEAGSGFARVEKVCRAIAAAGRQAQLQEINEVAMPSTLRRDAVSRFDFIRAAIRHGNSEQQAIEEWQNPSLGVDVARLTRADLEVYWIPVYTLKGLASPSRNRRRRR